MQIKRSYELEKKGLSLNPYLFEDEAALIRKAQYSKNSSYQGLYNELYSKSMRRLDKPVQVSDLYVLARIYKYVLIKTGRADIHESFDKDYFTFLAMYQTRVDPSKQEDIESVCFQIFIHKNNIMASDQHLDVL